MVVHHGWHDNLKVHFPVFCSFSNWTASHEFSNRFLMYDQLDYNDHTMACWISFVNQSVENLVPWWPRLIHRCSKRTVVRCDPSS